MKDQQPISDVARQLAATLPRRAEPFRADEYRQLAVDALNELQALRKQIIHGGAWTKKVDDLIARGRELL